MMIRIARAASLPLCFLLLATAGCPVQGGGEPCLNGALDPEEADVDCGSVCDVLCALGQACEVAGDCQSGSCEASVCVEVTQPGCGDGVRQAGEACEGTDLGTETCESLGFGAGGSLSCTETCSFDTASCAGCPVFHSTSPVAPGSQWAKAGPPGGRVSSLLALEAGVVLAGTGFSRGVAGASPGSYGSAIYRSTNGGVSFSERQRFVNSTVRALVRVGSSQRIYAGVGSLSGANTDSADDGVWRSDDGGDTWQNVSAGLHPYARVRGVVVAPGTPERVWAMVEGTAASPINAIPSLYRRDDGGSWVASPLTGVDQVTGGPALAMTGHPTDRERLTLASGDRIFDSTDGGNTFTAAAFDPLIFDPNGLRWTLGLHRNPLESSHLVLTTHDHELFQSLDDGVTWAKTDLPGGGQEGVAFTPGQVWVATRGVGLHRSTAGSFAPIGACLADPVPTQVAIAPDDPQQVYVGFHGQGVLHSTDGGQTFFPQSAGLTDLGAKVVVTGPSTAPVAWVVSGAGLHRSVDRGDNWERVADQQGTLAFSAVAQDPEDPDHILAATNGSQYAGSGVSMGVFDLDLGTGSVRRSLGLSGLYPGVIAVAFDPLVSGRAFAYQQTGLHGDPALSPSALFASTNGGAAFAQTPMGGHSLLPVIWFARSPLEMTASGDLLMGVYTDDTNGTVEVWRTRDGGATHEVLWSGNTNGPYAGVYADPAGDLYLGGPSPTGLQKSVDDGVTFTDFGGGLSGFSAMVRDVAFSPSGAILVGTVDGAYYAADGETFVELNEGFEAFARGPETTSVAIVPGATGEPDVGLIGTVVGVFGRQLP